MAITSLYFLYVDNSWKVFFAITLVGITIAFILLSRMPESPSYLVNMGRYDEARSVIARIASFNNLTEFDFKDDRIAQDYHKNSQD